MATDAEETPSNTLRERAGASRVKLWLFLDADRRLVALLPLLVVGVALVVLGAVDPTPLRASANAKDPIETLFQALTTAIITGVTLVVSLNQLVLSQELGPLGDQHERMEGSLKFRRTVEDVLGASVSPVEPSAFIRALVGGAEARAERLGDLVADCDDEEARARITEFADELTKNAREVAVALEGEQFGTFDVVNAALNFNYSWKIHQARRLRDEYESSLAAETCEAFDDLVETLRLFGPAREHVKTLYFQWELVDLSRGVLLSAIPALIVSISGVLYLDNPATVTGTLFGVDTLVWVVSAAVAVSLVPFTLLFAYVLRIATVAKRTLSIGPFILRKTDGSEPAVRE